MFLSFSLFLTLQRCAPNSCRRNRPSPLRSRPFGPGEEKVEEKVEEGFENPFGFEFLKGEVDQGYIKASLFGSTFRCVVHTLGSASPIGLLLAMRSLFFVWLMYSVLEDMLRPLATPETKPESHSHALHPSHISCCYLFLLRRTSSCSAAAPGWAASCAGTLRPPPSRGDLGRRSFPAWRSWSVLRLPEPPWKMKRLPSYPQPPQRALFRLRLLRSRFSPRTGTTEATVETMTMMGFPPPPPPPSSYLPHFWRFPLLRSSPPPSAASCSPPTGKERWKREDGERKA